MLSLTWESGDRTPFLSTASALARSAPGDGNISGRLRTLLHRHVAGVSVAQSARPLSPNDRAKAPRNLQATCSAAEVVVDNCRDAACPASSTPSPVCLSEPTSLGLPVFSRTPSVFGIARSSPCLSRPESPQVPADIAADPADTVCQESTQGRR